MSFSIKDQEVKNQAWEAPHFFEVTNENDLNKVQEAIRDIHATRFFDPMEYAVDELYDIHFPHEKDLPVQEKSSYESFKKRYEWPYGMFVHFPWDNTLIRFPRKDELRALRTSRNRNLITDDEQNKLYEATIFVAGLSVGSSIVEALVSMGIGTRFIIADMDVIEPSNLNRIRAPYRDVGIHKADAIAMRMSQIDPFIEWQIYRDGVTTDNLQEIMETYKPDIIVDEMDQLSLKVGMRREAKRRGIPVLSAADDGDSALLDIERFDLDESYPLYHGLIPEDILNHLEKDLEIPRQELGMLIGKYFVGSDHIPLRMFESLGEVGKSLPSWPQLGGAATQSGLAVAYATRRILLGQPLVSGRFVIGPDQVLNPEFQDPAYIEQLRHYQARLDG